MLNHVRLESPQVHCVGPHIDAHNEVVIWTPLQLLNLIWQRKLVHYLQLARLVDLLTRGKSQGPLGDHLRRVACYWRWPDAHHCESKPRFDTAQAR